MPATARVRCRSRRRRRPPRGDSPRPAAVGPTGSTPFHSASPRRSRDRADSVEQRVLHSLPERSADRSDDRSNREDDCQYDHGADELREVGEEAPSARRERRPRVDPGSEPEDVVSLRRRDRLREVFRVVREIIEPESTVDARNPVTSAVVRVTRELTLGTRSGDLVVITERRSTRYVGINRPRGRDFGAVPTPESRSWSRFRVGIDLGAPLEGQRSERNTRGLALTVAAIALDVATTVTPLTRNLAITGTRTTPRRAVPATGPTDGRSRAIALRTRLGNVSLDDAGGVTIRARDGRFPVAVRAVVAGPETVRTVDAATALAASALPHLGPSDRSATATGFTGARLGAAALAALGVPATATVGAAFHRRPVTGRTRFSAGPATPRAVRRRRVGDVFDGLRCEPVRSFLPAVRPWNASYGLTFVVGFRKDVLTARFGDPKPIVCRHLGGLASQFSDRRLAGDPVRYLLPLAQFGEQRFPDAPHRLPQLSPTRVEIWRSNDSSFRPIDPQSQDNGRPSDTEWFFRSLRVVLVCRA